MDDQAVPMREIRRQKLATRLRTLSLLPLGLVCTLSLGLFITQLMALLRSANSGLDISDEGYYLASAATRGGNLPLEGFWGALLHYLYLACVGNLETYRIVATLLLVGAATLLGVSAGQFLFGPKEKQVLNLSDWFLVAASALFAADSVLLFFVWRLLTPSYDWLNLVGICLLLSATLRSLRTQTPSKWGAIFTTGLFAVGGLFVFSARVGTFLIAALCGGAFVVFRLIRRRRAGVSIARRTFVEHVAVLVVAIGAYLVLVVSPTAIYAGLFRESTYTSSEGTHVGFLTRQAFSEVWHTIAVSVPFAAPVLITVLAMLCGGWLLCRFVSSVNASRLTAVVLDLLILAAFTWLVLKLHRASWIIGGTASLSVIPAASLAMLLFSATVVMLRPLVAPSRLASGALGLGHSGRIPRNLGLGALLLLSAYSYGYTSNNGLIPASTLSSGLIWLAAGLLLVASVSSTTMRMVAMTGILLVCTLVMRPVIAESIAHPYRITPIPTDFVSVAMPGSDGGEIHLSSADATFLLGLRVAALGAGLSASTPIEDFTPFNSGLGWFLGAIEPPTALLAVHPYPKILAWTVDQQSNQFRRRAWILTSDTAGKSGINIAVAAGIVGFHSTSSYVEVFQGLWPPENETITLWALESTP